MSLEHRVVPSVGGILGIWCQITTLKVRSHFGYKINGLSECYVGLLLQRITDSHMVPDQQ